MEVETEQDSLSTEGFDSAIIEEVDIMTEEGSHRHRLQQACSFLLGTIRRCLLHRVSRLKRP